MKKTNHAEIRAQQRAVPEIVVTWLHAYGAKRYSHGARLRFFDRAARRRLARHVPQEQLKQHEQKLNAYLVESFDDVVVTVGYRHRRIWN